MKKSILLSSLLLIAGTVLAADSAPKDDVINAAKKLSDQANYSWTVTTVVPESAQFKPGPIDGKTEKDGYTHVTLNFAGNKSQMVFKGDKATATGQNGTWQTGSELEGNRFMGRVVKNFKAPSAQATDLVAAAKEIKKDGDTYSGDLTDEGAKAQFRFGTVNDAKGSVKFWIKDGVLTKFESKMTGKADFNGTQTDIDRTVTTEIKDVGTTKVEVPEEAKKKLSGE